MKNESIKVSDNIGKTARAERRNRNLSTSDINRTKHVHDFCSNCPRYSKNLACPLKWTHSFE